MNRREFIAGSVTALGCTRLQCAVTPALVADSHLIRVVTPLPPTRWTYVPGGLSAIGEHWLLDENEIMFDIPWKEDV